MLLFPVLLLLFTKCTDGQSQDDIKTDFAKHYREFVGNFWEESQLIEVILTWGNLLIFRFSIG